MPRRAPKERKNSGLPDIRVGNPQKKKRGGRGQKQRAQKEPPIEEKVHEWAQQSSTDEIIQQFREVRSRYTEDLDQKLAPELKALAKELQDRDINHREIPALGEKESQPQNGREEHPPEKVHRRSFLKTAAKTGMGASILGALGLVTYQSTRPSKKTENPTIARLRKQGLRFPQYWAYDRHRLDLDERKRVENVAVAGGMEPQRVIEALETAKHVERGKDPALYQRLLQKGFSKTEINHLAAGNAWSHLAPVRKKL